MRAWLYPKGIDKNQSLARLLAYTTGRSARWMNENHLNPEGTIKFNGGIFEKGTTVRSGESLFLKNKTKFVCLVKVWSLSRCKSHCRYVSAFGNVSIQTFIRWKLLYSILIQHNYNLKFKETSYENKQWTSN